jgi:4-hydroxybenzoate polyprenyltransferase
MPSASRALVGLAPTGPTRERPVTSEAAGEHLGIAAAVVDLSRARQALLSVAQPALAAVIALQGLPSPSRVALGLVAASCGFLAVFSLNDVLDRRIDSESLSAGKGEVEGFDMDTAFVRHPLARGDLSLRLSLSWVVGLGLVSAASAYLLSPLCLALFATAVLLEVAYCSLRSVTWLKTIVSGLMVGVGGIAGWAAVAPLSVAVLPVFTFLALWEIGGRNLPNDLADVKVDRRVGIKTVATVFGSVVSARATLAVALATLAALVTLQQPPGVLASSLVMGVAVMAMPAVALVRSPTSMQAGHYFNRASLLPVLVLAAALAGLALRFLGGVGW